MDKKIYILLAALILAFVPKGTGQIVPKKYLFNQTPTHAELISTYKALELRHNTTCKLVEYGKSDAGNPIHLFIIDSDGEFSASEIKRAGKKIIFIMNGIHAGEPDGIDASIEFAEDVMLDKELRGYLDNVTIIIMPVYNVDGMLKRGNTRVNQNGPEEYGFRANSRNLDLNRDCIKTDSKNAQVLARFFTEWSPEFFIDTHVSNGADYRYVMTLIPTAPDKLEEPQKIYMRSELLPKLFEGMKKSGFEMAPYVNMKGATPDSGILAFNDSPRYTIGLASQFGILGFTTETHMLKPFADRVKATKAFITLLYKELGQNYDKVSVLKKQAEYATKKSEGFFLNFENDLSRSEPFLFKGYEAEYKPSEITGAKRLYYNHNRPFEREIAHYAYLRGKNFSSKPTYYLIPQEWPEIIEKLQLNGVLLDALEEDTLVSAEVYLIEDFKDPYVYEGRALVQPLKVNTIKKTMKAKAGDVMVVMGTEKDKFVMSVLEPMAKDSYLQWGFFNSVLERKEHFSAYVFEDLALDILKKNPALKEQMDDYFSKNSDLNTPENKLEYIYLHSGYAEPEKGIYPIYRVMP